MNNIEIEKALTGDYSKAYDTAMQYALTKGYTQDKISENLSDLYDVLLTAQEYGRPVEKVVGKDIGTFCQSYFGKYSLSDFLKSTAAFLFRSFIVIAIMELITAVAYDSGFLGYMGEKTEISSYIVILLIAAAVNAISFFVVAPLTAKKKALGDRANIALVIAIFFAIFMIPTESMPVKISVNAGVFFAFIIAYILAYFIIRSVIRYKKYGTISDIYKKAFKENWKKAYQDYPMQKGVLEGWKWRYNRLLKKGKATEETFVDVLKKEQKLCKFSNKFLIVFYAALTVWAIVDVASKSDILWVSLVAVCVMALICFVTYSIFVKPQLKIETICEQLLNECEKSGLTMPKFIEEKLKSVMK